MTSTGRRRTVERLVSELGRASNGLYVAEREASGSPELQLAHKLLMNATQAVAQVAREPDAADLVVVATAWEAIAVAQDLVADARQVAVTTREKRLMAAVVNAEAQMPAERAREHAARLRRWWLKHQRVKKA